MTNPSSDVLLDRPAFGRRPPREAPVPSVAIGAGTASRGAARGVDAITADLRQRIGPARAVRIGHLWLQLPTF